MVLGVGVDIITLTRMKDVVDTSGAVFLNKVFTPWEQERSRTHPDPVAYFAATFAAKEAIFKTFGTGWDEGGEFTEIEIRDGPHGEPLAVLSGKFAELAARRGATRVLVSLSFDGDYAIGMATLT
jgi:holo-[acyl-carrier protein] synthase